ncbi:MAG TPA: M23 family metallopeptidase [Dokdonella sp.]|uniref:OapA family protein n=1 Tax=Dokdonella sp. TaxID=2291710 RepID=UPI002D7F80CE|nr:M23 family metallopeptidase [Dokdonella sp.]HET9031313.1 M23 family metallopeptidase [Dokdonella sp.]
MSETNLPPDNENRVTGGLSLRQPARRQHLKFYLKNQTWTFLRNVAAAPVSWRREHWILGGAAVLMTVLVGVVMPTFASATRSDPASSALTTLHLPLPPLPAGASADAAIASLAADSGNEPNWTIAVVKPGQSLSDIFRDQGLAPSDLQRALDAQSDATALRRIRPGNEFAFDIDASGNLLALRFDRGDAARVTLHFTPEEVTETVQDRALERRVEMAHGVINSSLFEAGDQAGMSDLMTLRLAKAFGYDIDFAQDLRRGDSFSVIYDQVYRDGERLRGGDIIAATFINQGKRFTAIRFTNAKGETLFYTEDGRPLRKAFLRTPVEFTRISSKFSVGRMHPILGKMRAHRGVDYAAPRGTPIHAAGAGKVIFRGKQRGYGNVVILQHPGKFTTLYGHMSRFAAERVGQRVSQGQVIGYVGMTGLATGPHLHYEFRVNGKHRDPLSVTLPKEEPLPATELARFNKDSSVLIARLKMVESMHLARKD